MSLRSSRPLCRSRFAPARLQAPHLVSVDDVKYRVANDSVLALEILHVGHEGVSLVREYRDVDCGFF